MQSASVEADVSRGAAAPRFHVSPEGVQWLAAPGLSGQGWLWHGFSTRKRGISRAYVAALECPATDLGELNLGFTAEDLPENVRENRLRFIQAVAGKREIPFATIRQAHSNLSIVAGAEWFGNASENPPQADGIMTGQPGLLLGIQTADCIPVLVVDPAKRAVAAFHAGWRGTVQRIVELGVGQMAREFGSDPGEMLAAIGPGIGACCYTVGTEVRSQFQSNFSYAEELFTPAQKVVHLDLVEANRMQLLAAGLQAASIAVVGGCTSCQPDFFYSHRASGGRAGRMMAVIGIH